MFLSARLLPPPQCPSGPSAPCRPASGSCWTRRPSQGLSAWGTAPAGGRC